VNWLRRLRSACVLMRIVHRCEQLPQTSAAGQNEKFVLPSSRSAIHGSRPQSRQPAARSYGKWPNLMLSATFPASLPPITSLPVGSGTMQKAQR
jgi:hypothetical protein